MQAYEPATSGLSTANRLDQIRMSENERRMARASMRQAELIVDVLIRASDARRHVFGSIGRGIGALARRDKVTSVARTWRAP